MTRRFVLSLLNLSLATSACAQQWTAVALHPVGFQSSEVYAVSATHQGGFAALPYPPGGMLAGVWSGSGESWLALTLSGTTNQGIVRGMDPAHQVGVFNNDAVVWRGTMQSAVVMTPSGVLSATIGAVSGDIQVGGIRTLWNIAHAGFWRGAPESFVDLHPPGAVQSAAGSTDGVLQGGFVSWGSITAEAPVIWNGSAASAIDLSIPGHPGGRVQGMSRGVQVGYVPFIGGDHAALWRGTPESFEDLNGGAHNARLFATTGRVHVGDGFMQATLVHALINFGTPDAWLDLHPFLPSQYSSFSHATSVCQDGDRIYVGGRAVNSATGQNEAVLWIGTLPCWANCDGSTTAPALAVADFACFLARFQDGDGYANCDRSTTPPVLNVADFTCFLRRFAAGCQ
jgi:hypothetical protein